MDFNNRKRTQNAHSSQNWLNFSNSENSSGLGDIDELLDLNQPPTIDSFSSYLPQTTYPSQLFFRGTQTSGEDVDSGFDHTPKRSCWSWSKSSTSQLRFSNARKNISSQSTVSMNESTFSSLNETQQTRLDAEQQLDSDIEELEQTFSQCCSQERFSQNNPREHGQSGWQDDEDCNELHLDQNDTEFNVQPIDSNVSNESEDETLCEEQASHDDENVHVGDGDNDEEPLENEENIPTSLFVSEINSILNLYKKIKSQYSDCAFVYGLASHTCKDVYPKYSHISLKRALLLSIVSCNSQNNAQPISIMAITRDSAAASTTMRHIGNYAKRFICISDDLKFNDKRSQSKCIQANSLLMARDGVCYIGDWLGLKPASLKYLQNVIDSGRVTVETTSNIGFPVKCSIWMYWTCSSKKMNQNQADLAVFSKLFGIPIVLDETPTPDVIDFIFAKHTTNQPESDSDDELEIDDHTIKKYLNFVSSISVEFDSEAMAMLKYYFIVTRAVRPNILTPKSFDVLQCLCECHAKLCLRTEVLKIDVIFAIELFEQFVLNIFAGQVMTKPMSNALVTNYEQVDEYMAEFGQWLDNYLASFNRTAHAFFQDNE